MSRTFVAVLLTTLLLLPDSSCLYFYPEDRLNEDGAADSMRKLKAAERKFKERAGEFGSLKQLGDEGLIDSPLVSVTRHAYRFYVEAKADSYIIKAVPVNSASGGLSFYLEETGVIRGGADANVNVRDQPLAGEYQ